MAHSVYTLLTSNYRAPGCMKVIVMSSAAGYIQ